LTGLNINFIKLDMIIDNLSLIRIITTCGFIRNYHILNTNGRGDPANIEKWKEKMKEIKTAPPQRAKNDRQASHIDDY
jgi:hypothetical protein